NVGAARRVPGDHDAPVGDLLVDRAAVRNVIDPHVQVGLGRAGGGPAATARKITRRGSGRRRHKRLRHPVAGRVLAVLAVRGGSKAVFFHASGAAVIAGQHIGERNRGASVLGSAARRQVPEKRVHVVAVEAAGFLDRIFGGDTGVV